MRKWLTKHFGIHFHTWSEWSGEIGKVINPKNQGTIGWWMKQTRKCTECKLTQMKVEES